MRFEFIRDDTLPLGAWALRARSHSDNVVVRHGANVETFDDRFFSGVWTGEFGAADFANADVRVGTGALLRDGHLELITPTHPYSGVYVTRTDGRLLASNSMVGLLAETDARPVVGRVHYFNVLSRQNRYPDHDHDFDFGHTVIRSLRLDRFVVDADLAVQRVTTTGNIRFSDFTSFRSRLTDVLAGLADNATCATRVQPLTLKATLSAGYDSAAAAALAWDAGWRDAVTIVRTDSGADDSGAAVAGHLGYRCESISADAWKACGPLPEAEFLVAAGPVTRVRLTAASTLRQSVILTGTMGDMAWKPGVPMIRRRYRRPFDYPGTEDGLNEWALRIGSVFLPVPSLGADDRAQLRRVAGAAELAPWKLNNDYDRPLPRRIAEERGVPRDAFGQRKMASAQVTASTQMADESRKDFDAWLREHGVTRATKRHRARRGTSRVALNLSQRFTSEDFADDVRNWRMVVYPTWRAAHLFHWAVERTRTRYGEPFFDG